jgi:hypothetical protein
MKTKSVVIILGLSCLATMVMGLALHEFRGWQDLTERSSDILIVRCTETPDPTVPDKNGVVHEMYGCVESNVNIVYVLKGTASTNSAAKLLSNTEQLQGEYYLIFSRYPGDFNAYDNYQVVPLGHEFSATGLDGKSLDQQIKAVLQMGLDHLNNQMQKEQREKERLEQILQQ